MTVANTATMGGTGTVGGATTVNSGGKLAPGTSPGILTFNSDLTLAGGAGVAAGATAIFEGGDRVDVNGTLTLDTDWNLTLLTGFQDGGTTTLFTYTTAGGTLDLTPDFDSTGLGFTPTSSLTLTDTGSAIVLNGISIVPEPAALALLLVGAVGLLRRRNG
ncbi:MAG: PEP-CTERM sorting domain-containing protein [Lentisphaeria bacterium]